MGASGWDYFVAYQPDLNRALRALQDKVLTEGDYWWAVPGKPAGAYDNRPRSLEELFTDEGVRTSGTHSILDMDRVLADGEEADYGTIQLVTADEALQCAGTRTLAREHVAAIDDLATRRWFGRCAILHDGAGTPNEIYFWGCSGD